jgi:hypothetical protein
MGSRRLGIYGIISAAAIVSGLLTGCSGSGASVQGASPIVVGTGGITNTSGTGPAGTSSGSTPSQVQVTVNGTVETGTLPANETIPASGIVATIPTGVPIINGLQFGPKFHGTKSAPTTGAQGEVDVDGVNTGLTVLADGSLSGILILVPGTHTIHAEGPFNIVNGTETLTVGQFNFGVLVGTDGVGSVPSALNFQLPANGGSLANGNFVTVTYPTPDFAGGTGTLTIQYSGISVVKTQTVLSGMATYRSLTSSAHSSIPAGGVDNVTFNYLP